MYLSKKFTFCEEINRSITPDAHGGYYYFNNNNKLAHCDLKKVSYFEIVDCMIGVILVFHPISGVVIQNTYTEELTHFDKGIMRIIGNTLKGHVVVDSKGRFIVVYYTLRIFDSLGEKVFTVALPSIAYNTTIDR